MRHTLAIAALAAVLPISAQLVVSPASATTAEGNTSNTYPFHSTFRYQQVHGDLRGASFAIKAIQLRGDGLSNSPGRIVDLEMFLSNGPYLGFSQLFDDNHGALYLNTFRRKLVNLPPFTAPTTPPARFTVVFPFDLPYPHLAIHDGVWEARVHSNSTTQTYVMDAHSGAPSDVSSRSSVATALGCVASGRQAPMTAGSQFHAYAAARLHAALFWSVSGPANAPSTILLGTAMIDAPVPGLCSNLFVQPLLSLAGVTSVDGLHAAGTYFLPYDPALVSVVLVQQGAALDTGRSDPIRVSVTNRAINLIPALPQGGADPIRRLWLLGNPTGQVGSMDSINYGLVVGFER